MEDDALGTPAALPEETPWALAQHLAAQGLPLSAVRERLLQAGLPSDDVTTLLRALQLKSSAAQAPIDHDAGLLAGMAKAGVGVATVLLTQRVSGRTGKLMLDGLLQVTASVMQEGLAETRVVPAQPEPAPSEPVSFEVTDGSPRCQVHPRLPSAGTCPRCGVPTCHSCAPTKGFGGTEFCAACERLPAVHEPRVKTAARRLAATVFAEAVLLTALMVVAPILGPGPGSGWGSVHYGVALGLPFVVLGSVQWFVRHPWPGAVGAAGSGVLVLTSLSVASDAVSVELLALLLAPMVAMLFALERLTTRRKAAKESRPVSGMTGTSAPHAVAPPAP